MSMRRIKNENFLYIVYGMSTFELSSVFHGQWEEGMDLSLND